ncbi:sugar-binding domain-containing protein [Chitinophaga sp. 212800010-3]|uniref:sugar-binding domain-containing protein n=1 Tax=unclassified Chitinophaga TaxID=2619133 RepID=UPI002DEC7C72|nr:Glycosyl hydrolases family 2, TIM barrel domain [Chitinophaga sp. 212800010-3]
MKGKYDLTIMKKKSLLLVSSLMTLACYSQTTATMHNSNILNIPLQSRWVKEVNQDHPLNSYPRPQLQRSNWQNLNGLWEYAITDSIVNYPENYNGKISVPFPIESALSGVQKTLKPENRLWYKTNFLKPSLTVGERIVLNFGAVDWQATVFINGKQVGVHSGGYQSFSFDITDYLKNGDNELLVKVYDPTDQGINPHGKQTLSPANIYYTPSSGIWQTVWLEKVPENHVNLLKVVPDIDKGTLNVNLNSVGKGEAIIVEVEALENGKKVSTASSTLYHNKSESISLQLKIPNARLWSPDDPFLYDLNVKLIKSGHIVDNVKSYFGMRKIDIQKDRNGFDRIFLNNKYTYNLGTLDQGFWPEGLYTAPTDEALAFDIKTIKSLGFNTIRKHIKIEPDRWYYYADKIGVLVWQDFVNPPHNLPDGSKVIFEKEVKETMNQLYNHPSIVTWVLFNERWGAYDQERLTKWVKSQDPSRLVNGHSGELLYVNDQLRFPSDHPWISSDMTDVHSYPDPRDVPTLPGKVKVIGEYGGIGVPVPGHEWDDVQGWGYVQGTASELKNKYTQMVGELKNLETKGLSASIYTQPFDVEGEENGLLTYDREIIKIPVNEIRAINQQLVPYTPGFSLDPRFNIATNIDINDNDGRYQEFLGEYRNGKRDSAFLRRLVLISLRKKNQEMLTQAGNDYISMLKAPFSKNNLEFISGITMTSKDKGFEMFLKNPDKVDVALYTNAARRKVWTIIDKEEVAPFTKGTPDWNTIQQRVINKFGNIGEELVLGRRMFYYGNVTKDWDNYGKYYKQYFEKAMTHSEYHINNATWPLFENVTDTNILKFAAQVMKYDLDHFDQENTEAYDTYANLLYKLNQTSEAIKWEEKALERKKGAPDEKIYADVLQKMKSGQPTWPTKN